jgi:hypothetical protein
MQGDLWRVASRGAVSGGLLVLPLLFVLAREQDFASLGPFADAWWVTLVLAIVGLGFAIDALGTMKRVLDRTGRALERGYDFRTVCFVLADLKRDMGFLLQGGRHFSVMEPKERVLVAFLRTLSAGLFALAGIWMSGALGVVLLFAARGLVTPLTLWTTTLLPACLFYAIGGVAVALEEGRVRRARREWFKQPWSEDLVAGEIEGWRQDLSDLSQPALQGADLPHRGPAVRRLGIIAVAVGVVVAVPIFTLVPTSAIGPILVTVAFPTFDRVQLRAAEVEAFRRYRVEPDPGVSPELAGEILHTLLFIGTSDPPAEGELEPVVRIETPWIPDYSDGNPVGTEPHRWEESIFARAMDQPSPELRAYLRGISSHEAHPDFARLATAADIDVALSRWTSPFSPSMTVASVPVPRFTRLREGAWAHLAYAANELVEGRPQEAEEAVREVISVGLLLGDQGPTLIDNLVGHVMAQSGARALEHLYATMGRTRELDEIVALRESSVRAAARIHTPPPVGVESLVRALPALVNDTSAVRGLRWEFFTLVTTLTPCLNLQRMVFGPDAEYERFVTSARDALVRWPSEEHLFELSRAGYLGASPNAESSFLGRLLGVAMRSGPGTCGDIVSRIESLDEVI